MTKYIFIGLFFCFCACKQENISSKIPVMLDDGIETASLKDGGLDETVIKAMADSIANGDYPNIHSVLILRNNKLVYENYWPGQDEIRTTDFVGLRQHHRDSLHDIRSITKSIVSAAMMIAIEQGKIKDVEQRIFDFFPEYKKYDTAQKSIITIKHLLTMSSGLYWSDDDPDFDDSLKTNTVTYGLDFILKQPIVSEPGTTFFYNNSSTQLLATILERATGMNIEEFTAKNLFEPLEIKHWDWTKEENGWICACAGLRMRSRDLAKLGMLYFNNGKWKDRQIIPARLMEEAISRHINPDKNSGYGYQFWMWTDTIKGKVVNITEAPGSGGQKIIFNKEKNLLLVITAGNYRNNNLRKSSYDLYLDFVYPAINK
ncbi:MAG TPA: serine hydrolase [Chitinophagaceae bacterium]